MSQNGEEGKYQLRTENNELKTSSRGFTGQGTATYENGDSYIGDFIDGTRQGTGVYMYAKSGHRYEGNWHENAKAGIGKMQYNNIGEYHGYWENGRRHGEGVFTYKNGDVYSGWWKYGEKSGHGYYLFKETGMKMNGEWENGQLNSGQWIYPNGLYFQGNFQNNKPKGAGTWFFKNGNKLEGEFEQAPRVLRDEDGNEIPPEPIINEATGEEIPQKPEYDLEWKTSTQIAASAHQVNSVEQ